MVGYGNLKEMLEGRGKKPLEIVEVDRHEEDEDDVEEVSEGIGS